MKTAWILFAAAIPAAVVPALAQQNFDFKSLDKLGANATESTNIHLEGDTLKLAISFLGGDQGPLRNLTGVYVRSFEFAKSGQYNEADLAPLRAYLKTLQWTKIVDVKEADETSEIYLQALPNNKLGGLAIVSSEPREVTVVFIAGVFNMSDLGKLSDDLGIPDIPLNRDGKKSDNSKKD
jgi:Domain of unknown function (DUF4252)